jgi:hypothetical protein
VSSPREICWGPTIYCSKQNKTKLKAKINTLQEKHIAYEAIKIECLQRWPDILVDEEGVPWGIPKLWCLYFLDISWSDMGITKLELLSIFHLISSFSFPYTWQLPSYKTSHISNISLCKIVNPLLVQFTSSTTLVNTQATVANSSKSSVIKITKKERDQEANANSDRNLLKQNSW